MQRQADARLLAAEFAAGRHAHHMRRKNDMLLSIELPLIGQTGPLVEVLDGILHGDR